VTAPAAEDPVAVLTATEPDDGYSARVIDAGGRSAAELREACAAFPSLEVSATGRANSILLRWPDPIDDCAHEEYEFVAANVRPPDAVVLTQVVVDGRDALEVSLEDPSVETAALRRVIQEIVAEAERLFALWHPELPEDGA